MDSTFTLPCIVCGAKLDPAFSRTTANAEPNQPSEATSFHTGGHYGSTAFDPMDRTELEINVCDRCLIAAGHAGRVLLYGPPPSRPPRDAVMWSPDPPDLA